MAESQKVVITLSANWFAAMAVALILAKATIWDIPWWAALCPAWAPLATAFSLYLAELFIWRARS